MKKKPLARKPSPRKPFTAKPLAGSSEKPAKRSFGDKPAPRPFGDKPAGRGFGDKPPARPFGDKKPGGKFGDAPAGKPLGRPFGRPKPGADDTRPFAGPRPVGRPPGRRPFADDEDGPRPAARPFAPRGKDAGRSFPPKPFGDEPAAKRPYNRKPVGDGPPAHPGRPSFGEGKPPAKRTARPRPFEGRDFEEQLSRPLGEEPRTRGKAAGRRVELDFDDLIYGVHAIEEALKAGEEILSLHVGVGRDRDPIVAELLAAAERLKVTVRFEKAEFFANIPYKAHQSLIAIGKSFPYVSLDEAMNVRRKDRLVIIMDHLTDPHNVGAILRTAECAGAQAAILPDRRSAGVNATVRKVSAGATSHLPIAKVGNLAQTIRSLKENGFTVVGAALDDESKDLTEVDFTGDVALVIGAEGEGLGRLVGKSCDLLVKIPLKGQVESLNASVAAGILLYEVVRQRRHIVS